MGQYSDDDRKDLIQRTLRETEVPPAGSVWRHYKGGLYSVVCVSMREDDLVILVTYRSNKFGTAWTRTLANFTETVEITTDMRKVPRFRREED